MAKTQPIAAIETVTPEMAKAWLAKNTTNRPIRQKRIKMLADDMAEGKWIVNGEAIKLSVSGQLLDGQHRLLAVLKADRSVPMFVIRELPDEVITTLDQGVTRTHGDVLAFKGISYPAICATTARNLFEYDSFGILDLKSSTTRAHVIAYYEKNKIAIDGAVRLGQTMVKDTHISCAALALSHVLISRRGSPRVDEFFTALREAEPRKNNPEQSPIVALRNFAMAPKALRSLSKMVPTILKTWNAWLKDEKVLVTYFRAGEAFPEIEK